MQSLNGRSSFSEALRAVRRSGRMAVIPDIKVRSPKEGALLRGRDPVELAKLLEAAGAAALSVVTEEESFGGSLELLEKVCCAVQVPVLRKDFIQDETQLKESQEAGADAVLLIAAHLEGPRLARLHEAAHRLGLETLIEVHTEAELKSVIGLQLDALGINNRDILQLERDGGTVATTERLARLVPDSIVLISESGIATVDDVRRAARAGATAVLVGTAILQADDPAACLQAMQSL